MNVAILVGAILAARGASRLASHLEDAAPPDFFEQPTALAHPSREYRNPIIVAQEWQRRLSAGECASRADLARQLGVTRARVTQVLGLLELPPEVVEALATFGDLLAKPIVTERGLRSILRLPAKEQKHVLRGPLSRQERVDVTSVRSVDAVRRERSVATKHAFRHSVVARRAVSPTGASAGPAPPSPQGRMVWR